MLRAIWCHFYNFKNVKNTHGGVFLLEKLQAKVTLLHGCFSRFLNCTNGTKSRKALSSTIILGCFEIPKNDGLCKIFCGRAKCNKKFSEFFCNLLKYCLIIAEKSTPTKWFLSYFFVTSLVYIIKSTKIILKSFNLHLWGMAQWLRRKIPKSGFPG